MSLLWLDSLNELIMTETNRYARSKNKPYWVDVTTSELVCFLGIQLLMGIHRLPKINNVWSKNRLLGVQAIQKCMTRARYWAIRSNLHVVDDSQIPPGGGITRKFKPVIDVLSNSFFTNYSPGQELAVDEAMVKFKGRARGKVFMPRKPIKSGFKIWCCCCSCCGYLCSFQVYEGMPINPCTGKRVEEKGMVMRVVRDLLSPFAGLNHVVYCDNYFSSGPLVDMLAKDNIYYAGTIKQRAAGFPDSLKDVRLAKGSYSAKKVGDVCYYAFNDRRVVSFVSNVFPESICDKVPRVQSNGGVIRHQSIPPLLPAYNKYMGGVDRLSQLRKTYGYERKSKRYWLRPFFQLLDYAVNNAFILYKHNCKLVGMKPMILLDFRLKLIELLLTHTRCRKRLDSVTGNAMDNMRVSCELVHCSKVGMKRGRCDYCIITGRTPVKHTSFTCRQCKKRLCKTVCFADYHSS